MGRCCSPRREGELSSRLSDGTVQAVTADFSDLHHYNEAGLMAIVVDPDFPSNRRFYTCQTHQTDTEPELQVQVIAWTIDATYTTATRADDPLVGGIPPTASVTTVVGSASARRGISGSRPATRLSGPLRKTCPHWGERSYGSTHRRALGHRQIRSIPQPGIPGSIAMVTGICRVWRSALARTRCGQWSTARAGTMRLTC